MDNNVIGGGAITTVSLKEEHFPLRHYQKKGLVVQFGHERCSSPTRFGLRSELNVVKLDLEVRSLTSTSSKRMARHWTSQCGSHNSVASLSANPPNKPFPPKHLCFIWTGWSSYSWWFWLRRIQPNYEQSIVGVKRRVMWTTIGLCLSTAVWFLWLLD